MLSYLEVWNYGIRMKQRMKTSSSKKRRPPGLACPVQPLGRVSDALARVGTSVACAENEVLPPLERSSEILAATLITHSANQRTLKHHRHSLLH